MRLTNVPICILLTLENKNLSCTAQPILSQSVDIITLIW